jgi:Ca2+-transporting ATPase
MSDLVMGEFLLALALLFALAYFVSGIFERARVPTILAALFVALFVKYTPIYSHIEPFVTGETFTTLAKLGVLFLLFFIGLQIDLEEMRSQSRDIITATLLNTTLPFIMGMTVMLYLGYDWVIAFVIGLTTMPTAEAVVVPILDEFGLAKTKVGNYIIGAGVLDDVIEVFLIAFVSIMVTNKTNLVSWDSSELLLIVIKIFCFIALAYSMRKFLLLPIAKWLQLNLKNRLLLSILVLFLFGGVAEYSDLGLVVGAIVAGILMNLVYKRAKEYSQPLMDTVATISYGFFALFFFLWIGFNINVSGIIKAPELTLLLFAAAFLGKVLGIFLMVPMKKLSAKEAWIVGIGLNARLTTEIIVAKILFDAHIIDLSLFSALVAAASLSTLTVPVALSLLMRRWRDTFYNTERIKSGEDNGI